MPNNFGPENTAVFNSLRVSKIHVFGNTIDMENTKAVWSDRNVRTASYMKGN